ncbi:MAG: hypothetical protein K2X46_06875 [Roseomonas sp.]|jgi:hypothetical protein|nr:hypothetical protein [Roseomonas sp.]
MPDGTQIGASRSLVAFPTVAGESDPRTIRCNEARDLAEAVTLLLDRHPGDVPVTAAELDALVAPLAPLHDALLKHLGKPRVLVNGWLVPEDVAQAMRRARTEPVALATVPTCERCEHEDETATDRGAGWPICDDCADEVAGRGIAP